MRTALAVATAILSVLGGCVPEKPHAPAPEAHYLVPAPWKGLRGVWFYPAARFGGEFTGLAVPMTGASGGNRTADGAPFDPAVPAAAVQSLQLPVVLRVTDLQNGRQIAVRADDTGPADPGRLVALDPAAMRLLGMTGVTAVAVRIDPDLTQALADRFGALPRAVATAPLGAVSAVPLGPPGSAAPAAGTAPARATSEADGETGSPVAVPRTVSTVPVGPTALALDAGSFSGEAAARTVAGAVGGRAEPTGDGRHPDWRVVAGPFATVADADRALDRAEAAGISGARIVVRSDSGASDPLANRP